MEEGLFRLPAVAGMLEDGFVEARLHTDGDAHIDRILELQAELTHSIATPFYVVIDPETGEIRGKFPGYTDDEQRFTDFLGRGLRVD